MQTNSRKQTGSTRPLHAPNKDAPPPKRILRAPAVLEKCDFRRSTLYSLMQEGRFPKPIKLGARAVGWLESEIDEWIEQQIAARDAEAA